jgi:hypothetical protein
VAPCEMFPSEDIAHRRERAFFETFNRGRI